VNFNGKFNSWEENIFNQENHKILYDWDEIFKRKFFDPDLFMRYQNQLKEFMKYLPKERCLVHGDFGFDNRASCKIIVLRKSNVYK
jgi:hygromycin-B 4-O-kinase